MIKKLKKKSKNFFYNKKTKKFFYNNLGVCCVIAYFIVCLFITKNESFLLFA